MSFIATAPSPATAPTSPANIVTNDGFFPDIDLDRLRGATRLDGTVTPQRLRDAVVEALISLNREFAIWKAEKLGAGVTALTQLPPHVDGMSVQQTLYLMAVYRTVKAVLVERYQGFDVTKSGVDQGETLEKLVDDERRAARWAVRDFLGQGHTTVELI